MVLDGSFGRTQRISQSEGGKPHSTVSLSSSHHQSAQNGHFSLLWVYLLAACLELTMSLMQAFFLSLPYIKEHCKAQASITLIRAPRLLYRLEHN